MKLLHPEEIEAILKKNAEHQPTPREMMRAFLGEFITEQRNIGKVRVEVDVLDPDTRCWRFTFEEKLS